MTFNSEKGIGRIQKINNPHQLLKIRVRKGTRSQINRKGKGKILQRTQQCASNKVKNK